MLNCTKRTLAECPAQPWKNGHGQTREIAVDAQTPYRWRVSRAGPVSSGSFSAYPGYDRVLMLLGEDAAVLSHVGRKPRRLPAMVPYRFKGEWETQIEISTPTDDWNLFALEEKAKAGCYPAYFTQGEEMQLPLAGQEHFVHCVIGSLELFEPNTGQRFGLEACDTLRVSRTTAREFLNLRVQSLSSKCTAVWTVIHCL